MADLQTLANARFQLKLRRNETAEKLFAREAARAALDAATRDFPADSQEVLNAQGAFLGAVGELNAARDAEATARTTLNNEIRAWLTVPGTPNLMTPDADYARMALTDAPVALFPVRLETRFGVDTSTPPKPVLHVRVYPDEFMSDMHERELTPEERVAGDAYWKDLPTDVNGNPVEDVNRWTAMAQKFGVPRAAYIVRAMEPVSEAVFPPPRATSPSRAAEAVLPDRWVVLAFKNGELRKFKEGLPIPEPLTLTPDPSDDAQTFVEVADGFTVPTSVAWTVNYAEALNKGMAIDLDLAGDELTSGFDRVMVLGVKTSMAPNAVKTFLTELVDAHHYTRGIDLVPPGTATNNVPGFPTPFTMREPTGEESFQIERVGPYDIDLSYTPDFYRLEDILGFTPGSGPFRFTRESYFLRHQILDAERMRRILWASTLGYFMSQMMNPEPTLFGDNQSYIFDDATVASARAFFLKYVSAQGPAPAFRVGAVPYGVLPAIAVSRMAAKTGESGLAIDVMRRLLPYWRDAATKVPKVPRNAPNPHIDLMKVISQKSRSDGAFIRNSVGVQTVANIYQLALQDFAELVSGLGKTAPPVVGSLGHPEWSAARIFGLTFMPFASLHAGPLVTAHPKDGKLVSAITQTGGPATDALNYLAFLGSNALPLNTVIRQEFMQNAQPVGELTPLLYLMARHALLLEMVDITRRVMPEFLADKGLQRIDLELFNISVNVPGPRNVSVMLDVISAPPPGAPAGQGISLFTAIRDNKKTGTGTVPFDPPVPPNHPGDQYGNLQTNLVELAGLDVRELERLFMETLDLAAHRFDAFVTALATRRLLNHRDASDINGNTYYGAYGFVEDVRPVTRTTRQIPGLGDVDVQPNNGGFIHAPSLRHATAAAILRSGRMAEKSDPTKYAIELPSERARRAGDLLDGLRDGQTLGALLGARLERALRERGQRDGINEMERYILALRTLYPQVANKSGNDPGLSADRIAARNVVDGKLVREAFNTPPGLPFGTGGLPGPTVPPGHAPAISQEVGRLNEIMDALGDLSMSEAIYQIAAGDVTTAEAAMNFLPQGNTPPEPEVTQTPTTGIAVNHRVALVLEPTTAGPVAGWSNSTPRAAVDPFVEDWAERQLGDPTAVTATLTYIPIHAPGSPTPPPVSVPFSIATLGIGALDFLALAQSTSVAGQSSPLDRMIETLFLEGSQEVTKPVITYDTPAAPGRSIPQLLELARALGSVLGTSRELAPADLRRAEDGIDDDALQGTVDILLGTGQTVGQVQAAIDALEDVRDALTNSDPYHALRDAAAYLADAFPVFDASVAELEAAAIGAQSELARRVTDGQSTLDGAAASGTNAAKIAGAIQALRILFGRNTLAVMPAFAVQGADEIRKSLSELGRPLNLTNPDDATSFDAHQAPGRFLQQAARVHEQLGAWRRFTMYAGAFRAKAPLVSVAQLPFVEGEDWAGRSPPTASRTSLVLMSASGQTAAPDPATPWRGLLLDQWTEIVPSGTAETGIAFHYDSQNSEAPQVILMAMHSLKVDVSGQPPRWSLLELHSIVNETMDLARSRPVDNDMLALGQLDPPILVASNSQNNVVSTNLGPDARRGQPVIG